MVNHNIYRIINHIDLGVLVKNLNIDENAHTILLKAKKECSKEGIEKPSHSDAIRWLWEKLNNNYGVEEKK